MRPPICAVCHESHDPKSDLVKFADYRPLPDGMVGHPHGFEWFCSKHLAKARALAHLPQEEAMKKMGR